MLAGAIVECCDGQFLAETSRAADLLDRKMMEATEVKTCQLSMPAFSASGQRWNLQGRGRQRHHPSLASGQQTSARRVGGRQRSMIVPVVVRQTEPRYNLFGTYQEGRRESDQGPRFVGERPRFAKVVVRRRPKHIDQLQVVGNVVHRGFSSVVGVAREETSLLDEAVA